MNLADYETGSPRLTRRFDKPEDKRWSFFAAKLSI